MPMYINGALIGLYNSSEAVNKGFVDRKFYSKKNAFFKCNPIAGAGPTTTALPNLVYLGTDSTLYYPAYELKSDDGWIDLINLCDTLKNTTASIEKILDVDRAIWMLAFNNALVNLDSYIGGFAQNYYLYRDNNDRFNPVVWDLNESFGRFAMTGSGNLNSNNAKQQMSHLLNLTDTDYPLVQELLAIPRYKKMYLAHLKTILTENFSSGTYQSQGQALQTTISAAVQADPNKFYTFANFQSNLTTDVGGGPEPSGGTTIGITNLMGPRATYLLGLSDFTATEPSITNVTVSNSTPALNATITIIATIANATANAVYLGYRTDIEKPFTRVLMYDDGAHNDGAANDGVYGLPVIMSNIFVQYYIYAENTTIGKFSPARAEHEFHTINIITPTAGDVVLNEVLASNSTTVADQNNEYDDWIELYNNTNGSIIIGGYYLSDNVDNLTKWKIPTGTIIPANGYLVFWADQDTTQTGPHTNFKLAVAGETIFLVNPSGTIVDQMFYPAQTTDIAYGRYANGTGAFQFLQPTFGAQNMLPTVTNNIEEKISCILAYPNPAHDFFNIELLNPTTVAYTLTVYDLNGRNIYQNKVRDKLSIPTSNWTSGMYIVRVGTTTFKIMLQ